MPYTPTNTFTSGSNLDAAGLQENFKEVRDYINSGIEDGDLQDAFVTHQEIQEGEFFVVTDDYNFPFSGNMYSGLYAVQDSFPSDRVYRTDSIKNWEHQDKPRYTSCGDIGKEIYLEDAAHVYFTVSFYAEDHIEDACRKDYFPWHTVFNNGGYDVPFYVALDGNVITDSIAYNFTEDALGTSINSDGAAGVADPWNGVGALRKFVTVTWMSDGVLQKGWHQVQLVVDPKSQKGYIGQFDVSIECFYNMGKNGNVKSNIAYYNQKPETNF